MGDEGEYFHGVLGGCSLVMAMAYLPPTLGGRAAVLIYSRKFISAKAEAWRVP